ncbi:MAG: hypothetical protein M0P69_21050 [Bacteroidales bacterium]|nr:hypothetical protein [Bacteroidales bacterium]
MKAKDEIFVACRAPGKTLKYIIPRETYERYFREEYGREMTEEEYSFLHERDVAMVEAIRALHEE